MARVAPCTTRAVDLPSMTCSGPPENRSCDPVLGGAPSTAGTTNQASCKDPSNRFQAMLAAVMVSATAREPHEYRHQYMHHHHYHSPHEAGHPCRRVHPVVAHPRTVVAALCLVASSLLFLACPRPVSDKPPPTDGPVKPQPGEPADDVYPSFMFVQTAESGAFLPADKTGGRARLELAGVAPETVYMSDRPERIAGSVANQPFLDALGFTQKSGPNAAVVLSSPASETQDVIIVTLLSPVYNDEQRTLQYEIEPIGEEVGGGLASWKSRKDASLPDRFGHASLFIDDCPDMPVICYGAFQCTGGGPSEHCCRVSCGGTGKTVGTCWHWFPPACTPCQDYSSDCTNTVCNNTSPFCQRDMCVSGTSAPCM